MFSISQQSVTSIYFQKFFDNPLHITGMTITAYAFNSVFSDQDLHLAALYSYRNPTYEFHRPLALMLLRSHHLAKAGSEIHLL